MKENLMQLVKKPKLETVNKNSAYQALWNDEHISKGMLEAHLSPTLDAASRNHSFIEQSIRWITQLVPPSQYGKLLDLGCGPGLYAEGFTRAGYSVTGVDFSKRSIEYATSQARLNNSNIEYRYQNYLTLDYVDEYDVITLIYCDYAPLSKADRTTLLEKVHQALKPNGVFIFDVFTPKMRKEETKTWLYYEEGGFFCEKPHLLLEVTYQYDNQDKTELHQHIVVTDSEVKCYVGQNHYFTKEDLLLETTPLGFSKYEFYGDVTGAAYSQDGDTICGVFTK